MHKDESPANRQGSFVLQEKKVPFFLKKKRRSLCGPLVTMGRMGTRVRALSTDSNVNARSAQLDGRVAMATSSSITRSGSRPRRSRSSVE
jgi:hypothetical protein